MCQVSCPHHVEEARKSTHQCPRVARATGGQDLVLQQCAQTVVKARLVDGDYTQVLYDTPERAKKHTPVA